MMMRRMQRKWRCLWASIGLTGQNISPIGRFFLTLYKQSCGSLSMLTLDHTTLFYFSLRDLDAGWHAQLVHDWVRKVPSNVNLKSTHRKSTPPLTHGSTCSSHAPQLTWSVLHAHIPVPMTMVSNSLKLAVLTLMRLGAMSKNLPSRALQLADECQAQ